MKVKIFVLTFLLLLSMIAFNVKIASATYPPKVDWAVIVVGTNAVINSITGQPTSGTDEPLRTAYYMFHVLRDHFGVPRNHIRFLHIDPSDNGFVVPYGTIDAECTKEEIKYTFSTWLQSTSNDNVLIYIGSHGGGYFAETNTMSYGARKEIGGDEGNETLESTYGQDVNGDGDKNDWFGVDESFALIDGNEPSYYAQCYYDDELKSDLQNVQCNQMIIIMSCCFAGGFIDYLSAPNRIIITSSSEVKATNMGRGEAYDEWFTPYTGYFIDAFNGDVFHRYHAVWNTSDVNNLIMDEYEVTVSDLESRRNVYTVNLTINLMEGVLPLSLD
jgi:hypothetical protein